VRPPFTLLSSLDVNSIFSQFSKRPLRERVVFLDLVLCFLASPILGLRDYGTSDTLSYCLKPMKFHVFSTLKFSLLLQQDLDFIVFFVV